MRRRSIVGPFVLILIGVFFLVRNVRPDLLPMARILDYWPFVLIAAGVAGLIEVLYYAGRGQPVSPSPMTGAAMVWIVVLCFILALVGRNRDFRFPDFGTDGAGFWGVGYDYDVNAAAPAQGVTRIVIDNVRGDVTVKGADSVEVKVTGRETIHAFSRSAADRVQSGAGVVHLERNGDELVVRTDDADGSGPRRVSADLDIVAPRGVSVESRGRNGELTVAGIDGAIEVSNGRGDVRLDHIGSDVRIEGRGGDIQLDDIGGTVAVKGEFSGTLEFHALAKPIEFTSSRTEFRAEAIPGTVMMDPGDLKISNISGPVRFRSRTRDIQVTDATGPLDLEVDRGDIEVTETRPPLPKINVHTHSGDITLALPENAGFEMEGSTSRGDVENDFGSPLRVESSGRSATIRGQTGAGPQITAATDRGTLSIRKG